MTKKTRSEEGRKVSSTFPRNTPTHIRTANHGPETLTLATDLAQGFGMLQGIPSLDGMLLLMDLKIITAEITLSN